MAERLYYADSFLRSFSATISDIRELARGEGESVWQIALDRTAFYPTSGGQPFDTGSLRAISRGGSVLEVPVESVEEDESGQVWHFVRKPLAAGTPVQGEVDWARRFDHMQQHSGQHLLSAVFAHELKAETLSFHLGESVSTIDLAGGPIAHHSLERVERLANEIIGEDRLLAVHAIPRAEAEAMLEAGELRKLPEREGQIRIVEIAAYDRNACGGTHVRSTGQIGGLLIRRTEKVSRGTRVEFVCGLRAVRAARADAVILSQLSSALSTGASEIAAVVERLKSESRSGAKERQKLREELAAYHAARLAVEVPIEAGLRFIDRCWKDRDRDYIRLLASRVIAAAPSTMVIFAAEEQDPARIFLARSGDLDLDCGALLKEILARFGLRGGGARDLAQGDVPVEQLNAVRSALSSAIRADTAATAGAR